MTYPNESNKPEDFGGRSKKDQDEMSETMNTPSMSDKIQKLLDQIRRDFPNGCEGQDCNHCPLYSEEPNTLIRKLCDAVEWQCPHNDEYRQE